MSLCTECKFCLSKDYGYSNYTVEGTGLYCLKNLNPSLDGLDKPYYFEDANTSVKEALEKANTCFGFVEGAGPDLDVEGKTSIKEWKDDPELYHYLKLWKG